MDYFGFSLPTVSGGQKDTMLAPLHQEQARQIRNRVHNALRTPFCLNDDALKELQRCFEHQFLFSDQQLYSPHPIYASLLHIDTVELYEEASNYRNRAGRVKPFIDIGGAVSKTVPSYRHGLPVHSCYLVNNPRDNHRHVANVSRLTEDDNLRADLLSHLYQNIQFDHPNFCGGCSSKCTFQCDFAIGIHSLYDMTPQMVYDTFQHHGLKMAVFCLLVPYELNFECSSDIRGYANRFPYSFKREGDDAYMHFSDGDFPYKHNFENWRFWTRASIITGENFSITINIVRRHGICWKLRMCRVPKTNLSLRRIIPCDFLSSYCLVPNLFEYAFNQVTTADRLSRIPVPKEFYNRVFNFVIKPEQVTISSVYQFALSIIARIDIASTTVNHAWLANARVVNEATYSIVFLALATRRLDREFTLASFSLIDAQQNQSETRSIFEFASDRLYSMWTNFTSYFGYNRKYTEPTDDALRVKNMLPYFYSDLEFDINHHLHYCMFMTPVDDTKFDYNIDNLTSFVGDHENIPSLTKQLCARVHESRPDNDCDSIASDDSQIPPGNFSTFNATTVNTNTKCNSVADPDEFPDWDEHISPQEEDYHPVDLSDDLDIPVIINNQPLPTLPAPKHDVLPVIHHLKLFKMQQVEQQCPIQHFDLVKEDLVSIPDAQYKRCINNLPSYNLKTPRTQAKLDNILQSLKIELRYPLLDVGAGPGFFSKCYKGIADAVEHYETPIIKSLRSNYRTIISVGKNSQLIEETLNECGDYATVLIDAAGPTFPYVLHKRYAEFTVQCSAQLVIHKLFTTDNNDALINFYCNVYQYVRPFKPNTSKELSAEYYLVCSEPSGACADARSIVNVLKEEWLIHAKLAHALREGCDHIPLNVSTKRIEPFSVTRRLTITTEEVAAALAYYSTLENQKYRNILGSINPSDVNTTLTFNIITGVAGAGKSVLASRMGNGTSMVITPTNDLKKEFDSSRLFEHWSVCTPHVAFSKYADTILIDECFTQAAAYPFIISHVCRASRIILAGSASQIGVIDPHKNLCQSRSISALLQDINLNSIRIPHDVARLISGLEPGTSSSSNVPRSIITIPANPAIASGEKFCSNVIRTLGYRVFSYNQETKRFLQKLANTTHTIHGLQGVTVNRAILYIDTVAVDHDFRNQLHHIMVSLTRHTDTLILVGRVDEITRVLYYNNTAFERNDLVFGKTQADFIGEVPVDRRNRIDVISENINYPKVSADVICDVLQDIIITGTQDDNEAAVLQSDAAPPASGKLRVKLWPFLAQYRKIIQGKYSGFYRFARRYTPSTFGTIKCFMDRYAKLTKNGDRTADTVCLVEGLASWCKDFSHDDDLNLTHDYNDFSFADEVILLLSTRAIKFLAAIQRELYKTVGGKTADNLITYFTTEYAKNLQSKGIPTTEADVDLDIECFRRCVDFFVKKQVKPDVRNFFDQRNKAHQGISAWKKYQNFLFASYTRMFTAIFQNLLLDNVIFASNEADNIIAARASQFIADAEDKLASGEILRNFAADFEQFDSSVTNAGPGLNSILMYVMGCPAWLCLEYLQQRGNWRLTEKWCYLIGLDKMHSGEPWTLMGNTIYNMAVLGAAFEFRDFAVAIFKGDDSGVIGGTVTSRSEEYLTEHGMSIKIETSCALEFAGFFLNRYGGFPDVLRRATKFVSTVYRDKKHYDESVINLRAELAIIRNNTAFLYGSHQCANYYNEVQRTQPVSAGQIQLIAGAMYHESFNEYSNLVEFDKNILVFRGCNLLN